MAICEICSRQYAPQSHDDPHTTRAALPMDALTLACCHSAHEVAVYLHASEVNSQHLLYAIAENADSAAILETWGISAWALAQDIEQLLLGEARPEANISSEATMGDDVTWLLEIAVAHARIERAHEVTLAHVLHAFLQLPDTVDAGVLLRRHVSTAHMAPSPQLTQQAAHHFSTQRVQAHAIQRPLYEEANKAFAPRPNGSWTTGHSHTHATPAAARPASPSRTSQVQHSSTGHRDQARQSSQRSEVHILLAEASNRSARLEAQLHSQAHLIQDLVEQVAQLRDQYVERRTVVSETSQSHAARAAPPKATSSDTHTCSVSSSDKAASTRSSSSRGRSQQSRSRKRANRQYGFNKACQKHRKIRNRANNKSHSQSRRKSQSHKRLFSRLRKLQQQRYNGRYSWSRKRATSRLRRNSQLRQYNRFSRRTESHREQNNRQAHGATRTPSYSRQQNNVRAKESFADKQTLHAQNQSKQNVSLSSSEHTETSGPQFYLSLNDDVVDAPSIGPKTAKRLQKVGVFHVRDLLTCEPQSVSKQVDVRHITADVLTDWQDQARLVCVIPFLRGTHAQLLVGAGYRDADAIVAADKTTIMANVLKFASTSKGQSVLRSGDPPDMEKILFWIENAHQAQTQRAA